MSNDFFNSAARARAAGSFANRASTLRADTGSSSPSRYATSSASNGSGGASSGSGSGSLAIGQFPESAIGYSPLSLASPSSPSSIGAGGSPSM
jgi:hypothetical protein